MPRVPVKDTSYSDPSQFAADVIAAAEAEGLSHDAAQIFAAHAAVSSGWGRSLKNFSLVGMKGASACACPPLSKYPVDNFPAAPTGYQAPSGCEWGHDFTCLLTREVVNGRSVRVRHPFRAYGSMREGVASALALLHGDRYTRSLGYLLAGDVRYFRQLGADGWYTASPAEVDTGGRAALAKIRNWESSGDLPTSSEGGAVLPWLLAGLALAVVVSAYLFRSLS